MADVQPLRLRAISRLMRCSKGRGDSQPDARDARAGEASSLTYARKSSSILFALLLVSPVSERVNNRACIYRTPFCILSVVLLIPWGCHCTFGNCARIELDTRSFAAFLIV